MRRISETQPPVTSKGSCTRAYFPIRLGGHLHPVKVCSRRVSPRVESPPKVHHGARYFFSIFKIFGDSDQIRRRSITRKYPFQTIHGVGGDFQTKVGVGMAFSDHSRRRNSMIGPPELIYSNNQARCIQIHLRRRQCPTSLLPIPPSMNMNGRCSGVPIQWRRHHYQFHRP
jgi:hypothetical protein